MPIRFLLTLFLVNAGCTTVYPPTEVSSSFASRSDFLQRLEPRGDRILFGSGIDFNPSTDRSSLERTRPAYYEVSYDLATLPYQWHLPVRDLLARHEDFLFLQIDLGLSNGGEAYAHAVADGRLDEPLSALSFGLRQIGRPVFLRIAPECNNPWNAYDPESYKQAWQRIVQTVRDSWSVANVAMVWSVAADGDADYMAFYPGDAYVDWWSVDVYTPADVRRRSTSAFIAEANRHSYPVLLEAATPLSKTPKSGDALWEMWFDPLFNFVRQQPSIKALSYRDWAEFDRLGDGVAAERFRLELSDPTYLQATNLEELRWVLEWE